MKKQIPNMITSLNILSGSLAVLLAASGDLIAAAVFILAGIFFDFFDGLAARVLKAQSEVGLQLDSLADVITSGLAPAVVMFQLLSISVTGNTTTIKDLIHQEWNSSLLLYLPFAGLMIVVAAAYRLAKFNVDERQAEGFIGLPTPANALLVLSFPLILEYQSSPVAEMWILNPIFLIAVTLIGSILMNVELPLFSLKLKSFNFKENTLPFLFLACALVLIFFLWYWAIPIILLLYVLFSVIHNRKRAL